MLKMGVLINKNHNYGKSAIKKAVEADQEQGEMMTAAMREMPLFAIVASEQLPEKVMLALLELLNGHFFKAIGRLFKGKG